MIQMLEQKSYVYQMTVKTLSQPRRQGEVRPEFEKAGKQVYGNDKEEDKIENRYKQQLVQ